MKNSILNMDENSSPKKRNYFNLVIGLAFFLYGSFRLWSYFSGADYSNFRLIIAIGFIVFGAWDLYKFIKPNK